MGFFSVFMKCILFSWSCKYLSSTRMTRKAEMSRLEVLATQKTHMIKMGFFSVFMKWILFSWLANIWVVPVLFIKSVLCLWVSVALFVVHVCMHTYIWYPVLHNHVCFYVRLFIGFINCAPTHHHPSVCVRASARACVYVCVHVRVRVRVCVCVCVCVCVWYW